MKILIASDYAYPLGGAEELIRNLRDELRSRGHEVRLFSTAMEDEPGTNFADYRCAGSDGPIRKTLLRTANFSAHSRLKSALREFDPDIVHVRMFLTQLSPAILPLLRDRAAIYHLALYLAICPTGLKHLPDGSRCEEPWGTACLRNGCVPMEVWPLRMAQLAVTRRWLDVFDRIVANSRYVADRMLEGGVHTEVIHNGIAVPELAGPPEAGRASKPTILFSGRLQREKGCAELITAFRRVVDRVADAELVIAGKGTERPALEHLVSTLGLTAHVRFAGHLASAGLQAQTRAAWMQVVPSLWEEPFGLAALDGMMQARPVIAANTGGLKEIVNHGLTGYLVDPRDADDLARSMIELIEAPERGRMMGLAGRQRAETEFSVKRLVDSFERLYREILVDRRLCRRA